MSRGALKQAPVVLCHLLSPYTGKATAEALIQRLNRDEALLDRVIELANRKFLIPTLYHELASLQLTSLVKPDLLGYLQAMAEFMEQRNRQLTQQVTEIVTILNKDGVTPLIMKGGAVLFSDLYPDKGSRFMIDLDLLLPMAELQHARRLLEENGYSIPEKCRSEEQRYYFCHHRHIEPLFKDGEPASIELHRQPVGKNNQHLLSAEECLQSARQINGLSVLGLNALRMSPEHQVILCFIHSEDSGNRKQGTLALDLRHLDYFVRLLHHYQGDLDWDYIASKICSDKNRYDFDLYLYKANQLFAAQPQELFNAATEEDLETQYQHALITCFVKEHPLWRAKVTFFGMSGFLNKDRLEKLYEIRNRKDLWRARIKYSGQLLKKFNSPSKLFKRIMLGYKLHE